MNTERANPEREHVEPNTPKGNPPRKSNEVDGQAGATSGVRPALEKDEDDDTAGGVGKGY